MKRRFKTILTGLFVLTLIGVGSSMFVAPEQAEACGWGRSGGQDYVPQRQGPAGPLASRPSLTREQALDIVSNHVRRLNPSLKVGQINDAGSFFEAEILSGDSEVVQLMGVDKASGRLMLIN